MSNPGTTEYLMQLTMSLEKKLIPSHQWHDPMKCGAPLPVLRMAVKAHREGIPTGLGHDPGYGYFILMSGQGPYPAYMDYPPEHMRKDVHCRAELQVEIQTLIEKEKKRRTEYALVAFKGGEGIVLHHRGRHLDFDTGLSGSSAREIGLVRYSDEDWWKSLPAKIQDITRKGGVLVWEGKPEWVMAHGTDVVLGRTNYLTTGQFRTPTSAEFRALRKRKFSRLWKTK